jgi:ferredoxin
VSQTGSGPGDQDQATEITILPDSERVTARPGETLLAALSRGGLGYRIGCRRGGCGVCKLHLLLGEVRYERAVADTVLTDEERVEGICLSCRAVPITNVVIELQEGDKLRRVLPLGFASGIVVRRQPRT